MLNIKYDIVGSFLRPGKIKKARQKYADGNLSLEELRKIEDEAGGGLWGRRFLAGYNVWTKGITYGLNCTEIRRNLCG